jgi:hypothetical protein
MENPEGKFEKLPSRLFISLSAQLHRTRKIDQKINTGLEKLTTL